MAVQCRKKIKKLKGDYRKIKGHNNKSGRNHKTSKYTEQLDSRTQASNKASSGAAE